MAQSTLNKELLSRAAKIGPTVTGHQPPTSPRSFPFWVFIEIEI